MQINQNEIESIEEAGILDGHSVKMIRTKGGLWIAVGKPKGKPRDEALSAGSHPAIVKYNLEKQYPGFQPSMMKSEYFNSDAIVDKHSRFLTEDLLKSGHDVYSVQTGNEINFHITKHNLRVASAQGVLENGNIVMRNYSFPKEFSKAISGAVVEKGMSNGAAKVRLEK